MLKRTAAALMAFLFIIGMSSCKKEDVTIGEKPVLFGIETTEQVGRFDIYSVVRATADLDFSVAEESFEEIFGIELNLTAQGAIDVSGTKAMQQVQSTGADGLYLFQTASIDRINDMIESGEILPLNEYLAENPTWNELPAAMRNMYADADGDVWALPRGLTPVVTGRVFRADYLEELNLDPPDSLDTLYEVSKVLADSDPDGNGMKDTYGMVYRNAGSFKDIFYANGVPVNVSNDGYQYTTIAYNEFYGSFEDSMLLEDMQETLEFISKMNSGKILRKMSSRYSGNVSDFEGNASIANSYVTIPSYVFTDGKYTIVGGLRGKYAENLNPLTYSFNDGFYVLGANTENPSNTINNFVSLFFGDLDGYMFASRGVPGGSYQINAQIVEILDKSFFSYGWQSLVKSNPLFSYETMDMTMNIELGTGDILGDLIKRTAARDMYIESAMEQGIMYEVSMELAYPEVFTLKPGEIINSSAGAMFNSLFDRILSGRISIEDAMDKYVTDMKRLGMQEVINELNANIGEKTKYKYE